MTIKSPLQNIDYLDLTHSCHLPLWLVGEWEQFVLSSVVSLLLSLTTITAVGIWARICRLVPAGAGS